MTPEYKIAFKVGFKAAAKVIGNAFLGGFMLFGALLAFEDARKALSPDGIRKDLEATYGKETEKPKG